MTTTPEPLFIRVGYHPGTPLTDYHRVERLQWESYETYCGCIYVSPRSKVTTDNYEIAKPKLCGLCEFYYEREAIKDATEEKTR